MAPARAAMPRQVILFARAPAGEARAKGFSNGEAAALFGAFAAGWIAAARRSGARLVIATPPEDIPAWRGLAAMEAGGAVPAVIDQRGRSFGDRLEDAARRAGTGRAVLVGGDVAPSEKLLHEAFLALERGADAVIAPAGDGGVSLLALGEHDFDLLSEIGQRRRDVCSRLLAALAARARRVQQLGRTLDVDDRRGVRRLVRTGLLDLSLILLARRALDRAVLAPTSVAPPPPLEGCRVGPGLRAPPRAA